MSENKYCPELNESILLVTADIGKSLNMGYYRFPDGTDVKPFKFTNCGVGFKKLWSKIDQALRQHNLTEVVFGIESTGCYGEPLLHFLKKRGVKLVQVNPSHTKRVKELVDNSPNKTDEKDPKVIADIIVLGRALSVVIAEGVAAELRRLSQARERSVEMRTRLQNQLQDLVYLIFPEFLRVMNGVSSKTARYLLEHYTTVEQILALSPEELAVILRQVSRRQLGMERALELHHAADSTVGINEGRNSIAFEIQQLLQLLNICDAGVAETEERMMIELSKVSYSQFLLSIRGLGKVTIAGLIGEVGDFKEFKTIGELLKYAGLNLYEISSGAHKGKRRISKRGRPLLRKLLYLGTLNVVRAGGILHEQYQKYLEKGMLKMKALIAICRKLLGILFALVRDHCEYDPNFQKGLESQ